MRFSIDTSAILDGWRRHYPREAFPGLWDHLEALIRSGDLRASEEVKHELEKKDDDHPRLIDTRRGRSGADPFVIALAKVRGSAVITGETPSGSLKRPKIPDVCRAIGVEPIGLLDLIRREGWVFR